MGINKKRASRLFFYLFPSSQSQSHRHAQRLPPLSRQADSSPQAVEQFFVPCGVRLPKTPANELKPNLFEFLQRVQECFNKVKGNKRLVQLSRSDDRGHCLAIVTRSVAKVTPRGLRLSKTKTMDSMGVAPQGTNT